MQFEISITGAECQHAKTCNKTPVTRYVECTNKEYQDNFYAVSVDFLTVHHAQHHESPRKRPHHACLIQKIAVVKRNKRFPIHKICRIEYISKMGNESKCEQPCGVFVNVFGVVIAFCNKVAHNRTGESADNMHCNRQESRCIAGEYRPCNMVYGHCKNRNQLYMVCVESADIGLHCFTPCFFVSVT